MDVRYSGFWERLAASMVDSLWLVPAAFLPIIIVAWNDLLDPDSTAYMGFFLFWQFAFPALIYAFFWYRYQATPGKMVLGVRVVDARTCEGASLMQCLLRALASYLSFLVLGLGYLWVGIDRRKRGLHDYLSGTVVIHRPRETVVEPTVEAQPES